jgi:hypothetical protein
MLILLLALTLTCGLFAVAKAAPADALAAYSEHLTLEPQNCLGCGCPSCNCISCG